MKKKTINVRKKPDGKIPHLSEFYRLETDTIVNKRISGLGATTSEILADRDSIIVVPNTPVITGKCKAHEKNNLLGVMAKVMPDDIASYLYDTFTSRKHVKIMVTPESFWKVKRAFEEIGRSMYSCFLLWDECDKLTKDIDYRPDITLPLDEFFQFTQKAMVSATPLVPSDPRFKDFTWVEMVPDFEYKKAISLVQTNNVLQFLKEMLSDGQERTLFIFLNKTDMILALIQKLGLEEESSVFCSEKSVDKLKARGFKHAYVDWNPSKAKKYNWMTSRFFTAVDIEIEETPDVLIVSEPYLSEFTLMDPATDVIQAVGRFRNGTHDIVHVFNTDPDFPIRTEKGIKEYIQGAWAAYRAVEGLYDATTTNEARNALHDALEQMSFNGMITDGRPDYFKMDNYRDDALVKTSYHDVNKLLAAYQNAGAFDVAEPTTMFYPCGEKETLKLESSSISIKEKRKKMVEILDTLSAEDDTPFKMDYIDQLREVDSLIVEAYQKIGKAAIEKCGYSVRKLKEALIVHDYEEQANGVELLKLIRNSFQVGQRYTVPFVKNELIRLYGLLHITPPNHKKITAQTLGKHFLIDSNCYIRDKKTKENSRAIRIIESII